jgi:amino acid permease
LNIIGDTIAPTMGYWLRQWKLTGNLRYLADRRVVITLVTVVIILPITYSKNMKWLGISSVIAIFSASYTVLFVDIKGFISLIQAPGFAKGTIPFINVDPNFLIAIPLICLSFQCHIHVIPIYSDLKNGSRMRMSIVIFGALLICFSFYASVGFFGYTNFGSAVEGNVIKNYQINDLVALFARITVATLVALSYPLRYFATRKTFESLFFKDGMDTTTDILITTIFVIITILLSMFIPDITDIFGIIGSIGAVSLMFIFPGMLLWTTKNIGWRVFSIVLVIFGVIMGVSGTVVTVMDIVTKYKKIWNL